MGSGYAPDATVAYVVDALDAAQVPYMVTGSFASSVHGEPRATQDLDIVVRPTLQSLDRLLKAFPDDRFYVSVDAAHDALRRRGMFNVIEFSSGWKIDLLICKDRPFSEEEFGRRREISLGDQTLSIASAEDVILAKLEWARLGGSARQLEDVAAIVRIQREQLDLDYIKTWAPTLGVADLWLQLLEGDTAGR